MVAALVLGGGACLWSDVDAALDLGEYQMVVAANDAGAHWPGRLDHWVSLHPDKFPKWKHEREARGYPGGYVTWAHRPTPNNQRDTRDWGGSSGLFAVKVALEQGAERVVCCGVPLVKGEAHFFHADPWRSADAFRKGWKRNETELRGKVRSMSGWTAEFLGLADEAWLAVSSPPCPTPSG